MAWNGGAVLRACGGGDSKAVAAADVMVAIVVSDGGGNGAHDDANDDASASASHHLKQRLEAVAATEARDVTHGEGTKALEGRVTQRVVGALGHRNDGRELREVTVE